MKQHGVLLLTHEIKMSLFDNLDKPHGQSLTEDNEIPPLDHFPPNDYGSMRWWAFGSRGSGTNPHFDPYHTDAGDLRG